ncbi:GAF and ANTAR domain-containing protein [Pseudonocardia sp. HH130630-07]|uniref:GAF and ANTAR domain-containing protein n=1 Tax=Pseudonocardia sp. HH130630-07 TaxID=1690815 RepID=UPI0018D3A6E6|nr:GAF and ANTAR domain-containing protein [Pseudonocardia sp. HH130630-07]
MDLDVAGAVLAVITSPAGALDELVRRSALILDVTAGAALVSDGAVHGLVSAGPDGPRSVLSAGFGQGPGGECARTGRPIVCTDLAAVRPRWLSFTARAAQFGITGAWALPVPGGSGPLGALLLLGRGTEPPNLGVAGILAEAAAVRVSDRRERDRVEAETGQLRAALHSRIPIEQAKGVLSVWTGRDVDTAFDLLRSHARRNGRPLAEVAADVVSGDIDRSAFVDGS